MNRALALLSLAAVLLVPNIAFSQDCPADAAALPARFEVRANDLSAKEIAVQTDKSGRDLGRMSGSYSARRGLLGLTDAAFNWRLLGGKDACGRKLVVMDIVLKAQTVYVASEITPDTCTFRETVEHEQNHVRINRRYLSQVRDELAAELDASRYEDDKALVRAVNQQLVPLAEKKLKDVARIHDEFDHDDENASRTLACRNELAFYSAKVIAN